MTVRHELKTIKITMMMTTTWGIGSGRFF